MGIIHNYLVERKYLKLKDIDSYFPKELDVSLFVCTKDCGRAYLEPSKFVHICCDCQKEMKRLYDLKYELVEDCSSEDKFIDYDIVKGNTDNTLDWIDDITYDDLVNGKVDCIGDIDTIYIGFATCKKKCGYYALILDGGPQACPKCGEDIYRWKAKKYKLIKK